MEEKAPNVQDLMKAFSSAPQQSEILSNNPFSGIFDSSMFQKLLSSKNIPFLADIFTNIGMMLKTGKENRLILSGVVNGSMIDMELENELMISIAKKILDEKLDDMQKMLTPAQVSQSK